MKKIIRTIFVVLFIIPCAFFMAACGDKSGDENPNENPIDIQSTAYDTLKIVANKSDYGMCSDKTMNITGSSEYFYDAKLEGVYDNKTKLEYDKIIADTKNDFESCYQSAVTLAYKKDGTAILKNKYRDSDNTDDKWIEEDDYVINNEGTFLLCSIETYPENDPYFSFRKADKDYFIKSLELENFGDDLRFYNNDFLNVVKSSDDVNAFMKNMKQQICEFESTMNEIIAYDDISCSIDVSYDAATQIYTLNFKMLVGNLKINVIQGSTAGDSNMNAIITLKFNSENLLEYNYESNITNYISYPINSETNAPIFDSTIQINLKSNCVFTNGIDDSLWDSRIKENIPDNMDDVTPVFLSVAVSANGVLSHCSVSYTFDHVIDFVNVKNDLFEFSILDGFGCDESMIKSVNYFLDEEHTIEFSAENITKFPSYNMVIYADIQLCDNIATIKYNYSSDSYMDMIFVFEGEVDLAQFTYDQEINKIILNGQSIDFSSGKIYVEAGKTYVLEFFLK